MKTTTKQITLLIIIFSAIIYILAIWQYSKRFDKNFYGFACIGEYFKAPFLPKNDTYILKKSYGYDGQFFLYAAYDPFVLKNEVKKSMDSPAYRYQRILYPVLTKIFSLNIPKLYPFMLVFINVLSIILTVYVLIKILELFKLNIIYSTFYIFFSGLLLCVFRDLSEPLNLLFIASSYYFFLRNKFVLFFIALTCSLLSKETSLLLLPSFLIFAVKDKKYKIIFGILFSIIIFFIWQFYLKNKLGVFPYKGGTSNFDFPLKAMFLYNLNIYNGNENLILKTYVFLFSLTTLFTYVISVKELSKKVTVFSLSFFTLSVFYSFMSKSVWIEPWSFARVFLPLTLLLLLTFFESKSKIFLVPLVAHIVLFPLILLWEKVIHF